MNKELQDAVSVAKEMLCKKDSYELIPGRMGSSEECEWLSSQEKHALSTLISCAEELEAIKGTPDELPKNCEIIQRVGLVEGITIGQADMIASLVLDLVTPIVEKLKYDHSLSEVKLKQVIVDMEAEHQKQAVGIKQLEEKIKTLQHYEEENTMALQAELTCLKQKEELDVGVVAKVIDDHTYLIGTETTSYSNTQIDYDSVDEFKKELATAIVSRFSLGGVNKELLGALKKALKMLNYVDCPQNCNNGGIQVSEEEAIQCQWCDERSKLKQAISKIEKKRGV